MKDLVELIAPAKVNLVLAVGKPREDGFHTVHTIMHALALHDSLTMRRFEEDPGHGLEIVLKCENSGDIDPVNVPAEENIAYRAVQELARELGRNADETIMMSLSKVIPAEAGLGGGSSDAAAALLGAATLWGVDPQDERVLTVASKLGADVSFFLKGGCALFSGKGEQFEKALSPRKGFVVLIRPDEGVSTSKAYAAFDANPAYPEDGYVEALLAHEDAYEVKPWNNLTEAACQVTPAISEILTWAADQPQSKEVLLCGSGSAVCIVCDSYEDASVCSLEAHRHGWWNRVSSFAPLGASVLHAY